MLPIYLSSISWSLLRATSHCGSPVVWSISSQITSNMPGAERPLVHGFTPWPSISWCAQRIQSLGPAQSPASVSLFFLTGQLKKEKRKINENPNINETCITAIANQILLWKKLFNFWQYVITRWKIMHFLFCHSHSCPEMFPLTSIKLGCTCKILPFQIRSVWYGNLKVILSYSALERSTVK